jgi:hypothetical protein
MQLPTSRSPIGEATLPMKVEFVRAPTRACDAGDDPSNGALPMKVELPCRPCASGRGASGLGGAPDCTLPLKVEFSREPSIASCDTSGNASDTPTVDTDEDAISGSWSSDDFYPATPATRTRLRSQAAMYVPAASPTQEKRRFARKSIPGVNRDSKEHAAVTVRDDERTTVMMCNLPSSYTSDRLVVFLDLHGYSKQFDLVYVPINFSSMSGVGYAFVNLTTNEQATSFMRTFDGFDGWEMSSKSPCKILWSDVQGLDRNVSRYQDSPVMCESVPNVCKPILLKDGVQISFPTPTKKLRALKCRRGKVDRN